jgi:hypothetical protein
MNFAALTTHILYGAQAESQMFVSAHEADEWSRMAQDAYAHGHNAFGHRFSAASATMRGTIIALSVYDALMADYRHWLIFGWDGLA